MLTVVLDPGHGGDDPGCVYGALTEKDITLNVARRARQLILGSNLGMGCELTREDDETLGLSTRAQLSSKFGADLVVALHVNAVAAKAQGAISFVLPGVPLAYVVGETMSRAVPAPLYREQNRVILATDLPGTTDDWLGRSRNVLSKHFAPAVLFEMGFASDPDDLVQLLKPAVQEGLAAAVLCGVAAFFAAS